MSATIEKQENGNATLKVKIEKEQFDQALNKAYQKNKYRYTIPGFRKGKAPRKIIEAHYGKDVFTDDAIEIAFPDVFQKAVEELDIQPVGQPAVTKIDEVGPEGVTLTVDVPLAPEVKLGDYKGAKVEKFDKEVTDEELNTEIDKLRDQNARMNSVEDTEAKVGDSVVVDLTTYNKDGEKIEEEAKNETITLNPEGQNDVISKHFVGAKAGDEVKFDVPVPQEYHDQFGTDQLTYQAKVNEVLQKEVPEFDDDFVMDISEFDTVDEFKNDLKKSLQEKKTAQLRNEAANKAFQFARDNAEFTISEYLIEDEARSQLNNMVRGLKNQGIELDQYMQIMGMTQDQLVEDAKRNARAAIETEVLFDEIAKAEEIVLDEEEKNAKLEEYAKQYEKTVDELKELLGDQGVEYMLVGALRDKVIDYLLDNAEIVEEIVETEE